MGRAVYALRPFVQRFFALRVNFSLESLSRDDYIAKRKLLISAALPG